ncbi:MAG: hypothetical protein U1E60_30430 [Reyranellaceae bacterium]
MSDGRGTPPPPPRVILPPPEPPSRALSWCFAVSGAIVLVLTLGCMTAVVGDFRGNDLGIVVLCGSPTLLLGGLFLWVGVRRLKR